MNETISSNNPYSRLVALSKLGVVDDFSRIRSKCVTIVGLGGIGSVAAEMLARCGIGKLVVFDYDTVELANMNRMFYLPNQVGKSKVRAAIDTIININPDVLIEGHHVNICTIEGYKLLQDACTRSELLLCCVDNYTARLTINRVCLEAYHVWMESGVSESAVSGHIQTMVPGNSACFECAAPTMVAEGASELKREGVCAASLPTTMSIIAGLLVQNSLKYLLGFGQVSACLGYDALKDFFPAYPLFANPHCPNQLCVKAQTEVKANKTTNTETIDALKMVGPPQTQLTDNDWGIEVVSSETLEATEGTERPDLGKLSVSDLMVRLGRRNDR